MRGVLTVFAQLFCLCTRTNRCAGVGMETRKLMDKWDKLRTRRLLCNVYQYREYKQQGLYFESAYYS